VQTHNSLRPDGAIKRALLPTASAVSYSRPTSLISHLLRKHNINLFYNYVRHTLYIKKVYISHITVLYAILC
jgi:hypothetical protein